MIKNLYLLRGGVYKMTNETIKPKEKVIIYRRVSSKGDKQDPKLQNNDCLEFCKLNNFEVVENFEEKGSAYQLKNKRLLWEKTKTTAEKTKANIVLWRYDRAFRNRQEFFKFMKIMFEVYGLKVYSVKEPSIISFYKLIQETKSENPIFDNLLKGIMTLVWDFQIQQTGEQSEEDSRKISQRVKMAVVKEKGKPTKSYKGNIWGRTSLPKRTEKEIIEIKQKNPHMSIREIADSVFYWDKHKNRKFVSKSVVHKILSQQNSSNF